MITVKREAETKKLYALGLQFGKAVKVVEMYWDTRQVLVYPTCCDIKHQRRGSYKGRPQKCIICVGPHKIEDHQCGVTKYQKEKGKICVYVTPKCANCMGAHTSNSPHYSLRYKAEISAKKKAKKIQKEKKPASNTGNNVNSFVVLHFCSHQFLIDKCCL